MRSDTAHICLEDEKYWMKNSTFIKKCSLFITFFNNQVNPIKDNGKLKKNNVKTTISLSFSLIHFKNVTSNNISVRKFYTFSANDVNHSIFLFKNA